MLEKKLINQIAILALLLGLFLVGWYVVKEVIISVFFGILVAYIFYSTYSWLASKIRSETISAFLICFFIFIIVASAISIAIGSLLTQGLDIYDNFQELDLKAIAGIILPDFIENTELLDTTINSLNSYIARSIVDLINSIPNLIIKLPMVMIHMFLFLFVLFFALKDGKSAVDYLISLSPLRKETHDRFFKSFRDVTRSVLIGQIVVGLIQGTIAGIGYFIFGVPHAIIFTLLTILASVIPIIGPWLVWVPVDVYLFGTGRTVAAVGLLIYGIFIVSWIDNLLRPIIISRGTKVNSAIIMVGMLGGLLTFGVLGLILGPLILTYILLVLELYRKKNNETMIVFQETD